MALRPAKQEEKERASDRGAASDRHLWFVWMGLMVVAVALLPFIVREGALVRALADMCITVLGL
jgi:hypothetical protein